MGSLKVISALVDSTALITSTLELDGVLNLILEQLAEVVNYDRAAIQFLFGGTLRIIAGRGFSRPDNLSDIRFDPRQNSLTRRLLEGRQPVVLDDCPSRAPCLFHLSGEYLMWWVKKGPVDPPLLTTTTQNPPVIFTYGAIPDANTYASSVA